MAEPPTSTASRMTATSALRSTAEHRRTVVPAEARRSASGPSHRSSTLSTAVWARATISLLASTIRSSDLIRSRCTGPMAVMTAIDGGHHSTRSAISPGP